MREPLAELSRRAADAILAHYHSGQPVARASKEDSTPITAADMAAHEVIVAGLERFGLPVLSEESVPSLEERRQWSAFWMVDPLDGTKEFLERTGEFCVNIALIDQHRPRFGLIGVPLTGVIYAGGAGMGAWRCEKQEWAPIHCRPLVESEPVVVLASRRHRGERLEACLDAIEQRVPALERDNSGSAIKFCQMAEGGADFYPRFSPCSEWDTAAGQALLEGAGGAVLGLDLEPLRYNARETLLSPNFYALADPTHALWRNLP